MLATRNGQLTVNLDTEAAKLRYYNECLPDTPTPGQKTPEFRPSRVEYLHEFLSSGITSHSGTGQLCPSNQCATHRNSEIPDSLVNMSPNRFQRVSLYLLHKRLDVNVRNIAWILPLEVSDGIFDISPE